MTIHETIKNQIKEAMRAKDSIRLDTLRGLNALFMNEMLTNKSLDQNAEYLSDDKVLALIKRSVKQRHDSIRQFEIGKRIDLADKERAEIKILETFLPQSATKAEIEAVVKRLATDLMKTGALDPKSIGKLTGMTMKELAGNADGNDVKEVIENLINKK
jgi:uncharacterized protein YqeY